MVVKVKVCMNADDINEAKRKNEFYKQQRELNLKRPKKDKTLVPEDVEVPEQVIEVHERLWDVNDVVEAWVNEFNKEFISVVHLYSQVKMIVYSDEVWSQIQERFSKKLDFPGLKN
jgi:hypothetical protein